LIKIKKKCVYNDSDWRGTSIATKKNKFTVKVQNASNLMIGFASKKLI